VKYKPKERFPDAQKPEPDYTCESLEDLKFPFKRKSPELQQTDM
jgi:hypothetical protein